MLGYAFYHSAIWARNRLWSRVVKGISFMSSARLCKAHASVENITLSSTTRLLYCHGADHAPARGVLWQAHYPPRQGSVASCLFFCLEHALACTGGYLLAPLFGEDSSGSNQRCLFLMFSKWKIISIYLLTRRVSPVWGVTELRY